MRCILCGANPRHMLCLALLVCMHYHIFKFVSTPARYCVLGPVCISENTGNRSRDKIGLPSYTLPHDGLMEVKTETPLPSLPLCLRNHSTHRLGRSLAPPPSAYEPSLRLDDYSNDLLLSHDQTDELVRQPCPPAECCENLIGGVTNRISLVNRTSRQHRLMKRVRRIAIAPPPHHNTYSHCHPLGSRDHSQVDDG